MPRPSTRVRTKAEEKKHQAMLKARRERRHQREAIERGEAAAERAATSDNEGEMNFQALVAREEEIIKGKRAKTLAELSAVGGAQSPKTVTMARQHLSDAFDFLGGVAALVVWGRENLTEFYKLWARMIPKDAPSEDQNMPLESLLAKLAEQSDVPVMQAAMQIGAQELEKGRAGAQAEEAEQALMPKPDKIVYN